MKKVILALGLCAVIAAPAFANDHGAADHAAPGAEAAAHEGEHAAAETTTTTTTKSKKKMKARAKKAEKEAAHEGAEHH